MTNIQNVNTRLTQILSTEKPDLQEVIAMSLASIEKLEEVLDAPKGLIHNKKTFENIWSFEARDYAILLRDICFFLYKNSYTKKVIPESELAEIKSTLTKATESLRITYDRIQDGSLNARSEEEWKHYLSPKDFISQQLHHLSTQIEEIQASKKYLDDVDYYVKSTVSSIENQLEEYERDIELITSGFHKLYSEHVISSDILEENHIKAFKTALDKLYRQLEDLEIDKSRPENTNLSNKKKNIPMKVAEGNLVFKEIDLEREIIKWVDDNIYPSMLDCGRLLERVHEKVGRTILNAKNRIELYFQEDSPSDSNIRQVMKTSWNGEKDALVKLEKDFHLVHESLEKKIERLVISHIFDENRLFLPQDVLQDASTIESEKWTDLLPVQKVNAIVDIVKHKILSSSLVEQDGISGIINYVKARSLVDVDNITYSLFLNKGYLGNSFVIKRKNILSQIDDNLNNWMSGFRGSVLLAGKRLSGRSTIIESMTHLYPEHNVVHLLPNQEIKYKSRNFNAKYDLGEALDFITKNAVSDQVIVTIDDLELWRDEEHAIFDNLKQLMDGLNKFSRRIFFLVSTNHWFKVKIDNYFHFSDSFTAIINTDEMSTANIVKAIKLRHGASLRESLFQHPDQEQEATTEDISKLAKLVVKESNNIVGASLKDWAHLYFSEGPNEIEKISFPSKLMQVLKEKWTVFHHILKYRHTNEKEIMKMLGATFLKEVSTDIQYLISCKILERNADGLIVVNEFIVDEIETYLLNSTFKSLAP